MFARSTTMDAHPSQVEAGIAHVRDTVMPALSHIQGYLGLSLMIDRASGRGITTSAWRSQDAMQASRDRVAALRDDTAEIFGSSGATVETWEVAVLHRAHHARQGTWMRSTWLALDAAEIAGAVETFKHSTLAKIEDLPGFCNASLLVDHAAGRAVTTVGYDDRSSLEYSRDGADAVRDEASRAMEANVLLVAELELVLAHLHIPETV